MVDDINNYDGGPSMFQQMSPILFFPKKCQRGRLLEILIVIIFGKIVIHVLVV